MSSVLNNIYLHDKTRATNLVVPHSDYVDIDKYPEQDTNILGTFVNLRFRNMYKAESEDFVSPSDIGDERDIFERSFFILRFDLSEPYMMIGINNDFDIVAVTDSRYYEEIVMEYPIQLSEYIGFNVLDKYDSGAVEGRIVRCDEGEPCHTVIMEEFLDGSIRFVLGDECLSILNKHLNGANPDYIDQEIQHNIYEIAEIRKNLFRNIQFGDNDESN